MKSSATMCELARAIAIRNGPNRLGPIYGYSVSIGQLRTLYTRNGFLQLDRVIKAHVDGWVMADMAFRARDLVFFYLDPDNYEERAALRELEKSEGEPGIEIVGMLI